MYQRIISLAPSNTEILYALVQNKITEKYKKMGLNIESVMPTTLIGIYNSIKKIGKLVGKENEARRKETFLFGRKQFML